MPDKKYPFSYKKRGDDIVLAMAYMNHVDTPFNHPKRSMVQGILEAMHKTKGGTMWLTGKELALANSISKWAQDYRAKMAVADVVPAPLKAEGALQTELLLLLDYSPTHTSTRGPKPRKFTPRPVSLNNPYIEVAKAFGSLLRCRGMIGWTTYPTNYGIGVWRLCNNFFNIDQGTICNILDEVGVIYKTEDSDAKWIHRFRISRKKDNLNKINDFVDKTNKKLGI